MVGHPGELVVGAGSPSGAASDQGAVELSASVHAVKAAEQRARLQVMLAAPMAARLDLVWDGFEEISESLVTTRAACWAQAQEVSLPYGLDPLFLLREAQRLGPSGSPPEPYGWGDKVPAIRGDEEIRFPGAPVFKALKPMCWNAGKIAEWSQNYSNEPLRASTLDTLTRGADLRLVFEAGTTLEALVGSAEDRAGYRLNETDAGILRAKVDEYIADGSVQLVTDPELMDKVACLNVFVTRSGRVVFDGTRINSYGLSLNSLIDKKVFGIASPDSFCLANACSDTDGWQIGLVVDIKGAYRTIPVNPLVAFMCGFRVGHRVYVSTGMLFGITSAGFIWSQLASLVQYILFDQIGRAIGHRNVKVEKYGDDMLVLVRKLSLVSTVLPIFWRTLEGIGAPVAMQKCQLGPELVYIGIQMNLTDSRTEVKPDRLANIIETLLAVRAAAAEGKAIMRRTLESLAGKINYIAGQQLECGKASLASLYAACYSRPENPAVWLNSDVLQDLDLMVRLLRLGHAREHLPSKVAFVISDASGIDGGGAMLLRPGQPVQYLWFRFPEHLHLTDDGRAAWAQVDAGGQKSSSMLLELATIGVALATFGPWCPDTMMVVITDSQAAKGALKKTYSPGRWSSQILKAVSCISATHRLSVRSTQVSREFVKGADLLSHGNVAEFKVSVGLPTAEQQTPVNAGVLDLLLSRCPETTAVSEFFLKEK
jgi:hypothetical protein